MKKIILFLMICFPVRGVNAQIVSVRDSITSVAIWNQISAYFSPPKEYKEKYGEYRSPLKFYDGRLVKSPENWAKRRDEILSRWNTLMGEWPPLLKDQKMKILDSSKRDGFTQYRVEFYWTPNEKTNGYLLIPQKKGKMPAVITVYYEPETAVGFGKSDHPNRDFAYQLAKRGFVTLSLGTTKATEEKTYSLYYPDIQNARVEPLSMLACAAANAWYVLAKIPQVDSTKIGIMGHSFGGKWAMFASCLFDKFAAAVWSDPGIVFDESREAVNYWEPWYLGYYPRPWRKRGMITDENPAKGLYPELVKDGYDLQELHALMSPRPFLVSGGSEDPPKRWIPLNHTIEVNKLLGYKNRVGMTNRPTHSPSPESNEAAYLFFEYFLRLTNVQGNK
jgi:dienelactone hydrolase